MKSTLLIRRISKVALIISLMSISNSASAQEAVRANTMSDMTLLLIGAAGLIIIITSLMVIYRILELMVRMREIKIYEEHGLEDYLAEKRANEGPWWQRFSRSITAAVPIEKEGDILFDHDYDGIRELDNDLPPWWLYGFYLSIGIAVIYMGIYHVSSYGLSSHEEYALEMKEAEARVQEYLSKQADLVDETNVSLLTDEESLTKGKEIFVELCAVCHLESGGGGPMSVGPNLTDKYWIHGGSIVDVFTTVKYGVPEKGMISWKSQLRPTDMHVVSSYILSLQGTNPPGAKEPQGELYEPEAVEEPTTESDENSNLN